MNWILTGNNATARASTFCRQMAAVLQFPIEQCQTILRLALLASLPREFESYYWTDQNLLSPLACFTVRMFSKMNSPSILSKKCRGISRNKVLLYKCDCYLKSFHNACIKLATITLNGKTAKACPACITAATPPQSNHLLRSRSASVPSEDSSSRLGLKTTLQTPPTLDVSLLNFLEKIDGLNYSMVTQFDKMREKLKELDMLPSLVSRVGKTESWLEEIRRELNALKQQVDSKISNCSEITPDPGLADKILSLEKKNANLNTRIAHFTGMR